MAYFDAGDPDARIHRATAASPPISFEDHPPWRSPGTAPTSASGEPSGCLPRPSGEAARTSAAIPGATPRPAPTTRCSGVPTMRLIERMAVPRAPGRVLTCSATCGVDGSEYRPYPYRPDDGREAAGPRAARVVRGASHDDPPETLRVTIRRFYSYDGPHRGLARGHHHIGFRCATSEDLGGY
jgi:hypothetical protein